MRRDVPARPPSDFPAPSEFSLTPPSTPSEKGGLSLGLPRRGVEDTSPFSLDTDAEVGPDWRNALSAWVQEHAYYPGQAAAMGQQGAVRVLVTTRPDGKVVSVELEKRSGSPWLDLALQALFRGATLPPLPKQAGDRPISFHFTMRYILVR